MLIDSWAIFDEALGPSKTGPEFRALLDERVAPLVRQRVYEILFRPDNKNVWDGLACHDRGLVFRFCWTLASGNLTEGMRKLFRTDDAAAMALCLERLDSALDELDAFVSDKTSEYLGGAAPSADDLALAAFLAPLAVPRESLRRADLPLMASRRRRGRDADIPWRRVAAAATWTFRRGRDADIPWRRVAATPRPRRG